MIEEMKKLFEEIKNSNLGELITEETIKKTNEQYSDLLMNEIISKLGVPYNLDAWNKELEKAKESGDENKVKDIEYEIEKKKDSLLKFDKNIEFISTMIDFINNIK